MVIGAKVPTLRPRKAAPKLWAASASSSRPLASQHAFSAS